MERKLLNSYPFVCVALTFTTYSYKLNPHELQSPNKDLRAPFWVGKGWFSRQNKLTNPRHLMT